jgi:hypothetical protein
MARDAILILSRATLRVGRVEGWPHPPALVAILRDAQGFALRPQDEVQ